MEKKFQKIYFLGLTNFYKLKMLRRWPEKLVLSGKLEPRNCENGGSVRGFLPLTGRPKLQNFLAPLPLRSGRSAPEKIDSPRPRRGPRKAPPPLSSLRCLRHRPKLLASAAARRGLPTQKVVKASRIMVEYIGVKWVFRFHFNFWRWCA